MCIRSTGIHKTFIYIGYVTRVSAVLDQFCSEIISALVLLPLQEMLL